MEASGPLRAVRTWDAALPDREADRAVEEAMLLTVGERGYAKATVREVCERANVSQDRFHRRFSGKDACFARAYDAGANRLAAELVEATAAEEEWRDRFRAGLAALLRTVAEQPLLARALLLEVRSARGAAWAHHQRLVERLVAAIETAREQPGGRRSATPMTAGFVVGAIEESIAIEIAAGRAGEIERLLGDLTRLAFLQLFGDEESGEATAAEERPA
jgi:AcrR family transcriptional regulator